MGFEIPVGTGRRLGLNGLVGLAIDFLVCHIV
jgi:hypothetical protein